MTATRSKSKLSDRPPMVPAADVPAWGGAWSLGLPVPVAHAGDALEQAVEAGSAIPAPIAQAVRVAAHVSSWTNDAARIGQEAEATWRAQALEAARNLDTLPPLEDLIRSRAARDVDGLAAGILRDLARESVAAAYRAVRDHADDLIEHGLRPVWNDTLDRLEALAARMSPLIVDEVTAMNGGTGAADAWIEARPVAETYWQTIRARHSLQLVTGLDPRDPEAHALVGRRVDQRALRGAPAHRVAAALHRARTRQALDLWLPTVREYAAHLEAKAAA